MGVKVNTVVKAALGLDDDQRQNLTTFSMLGGAMAMTVAAGILVYIIRYSWSDKLLTSLAPAIVDGFFWVIYGVLALIAIQVVAQASIAIGGKISGKMGPAEFSAESETSVKQVKTSVTIE